MLNCQNVYRRICKSLENLIECEYDAPNLDRQLQLINEESYCDDSLTPLPNPLGNKCNSNSHNRSECQSRRNQLQQLQQRWTIRRTI